MAASTLSAVQPDYESPPNSTPWLSIIEPIAAGRRGLRIFRFLVVSFRLKSNDFWGACGPVPPEAILHLADAQARFVRLSAP